MLNLHELVFPQNIHLYQYQITLNNVCCTFKWSKIKTLSDVSLAVAAKKNESQVPYTIWFDVCRV